MLVDELVVVLAKGMTVVVCVCMLRVSVIFVFQSSWNLAYYISMYFMWTVFCFNCGSFCEI